MPMIIIMAVVGTIVAVNFVRSKKDERNLAAMKKTTAREEAQAKARAKQIVKIFYSQPKVNPTPALHKYGTYQHGNTCFVNLGDGKSQLMTWDEKQNCWIKPFAKAEVPTAAPTTAEEQPVAQTGKSYETIIGPDGKEYLAPDWRDIAEKYVKENRRIIEACLFSNENNCFKISADKLPDKRSWQFIGQKLIDDDDAEKFEIVDDGLIIYICD